MYEVRIIHIGDDDQVSAQREDDKLWVTVLEPPAPDEWVPGASARQPSNKALELFIDPAHFPVLRAAMDLVDARNSPEGDKKSGDI